MRGSGQSFESVGETMDWTTLIIGCCCFIGGAIITVITYIIGTLYLGP